MIKLITFTITAILLASCNSYDPKDLAFKSNEMRFISSYHVGDTIYYESLLGDIDTIMVYKIDSIQNSKMGTLAVNCLNVNIKHLPNDTLWTWKSRNNSTNGEEIMYQNLIRICKEPERKKTIYEINFRDFKSNYDSDSMGNYHTDTIIVNNKFITKYFEIKNENSENNRNQKSIELIYWTELDGLIAYKKSNGNWWTKKKTINNNST